MESYSREVKIYESSEGKVPFREWFDNLKDYQAKQKIRAKFARLRLGNFGDCKSISDGVSELKINFGPGYRIYFGQEGRDVVILLCGGDKSTQPQDILKAKQYWLDYKSRSNA